MAVVPKNDHANEDETDEENDVPASVVTDQGTMTEAKYLKQALKKPLPVAWLAPELFKQPCPQTTATDTWAYGVVLWELFTLGQEPYAETAQLEDLGRWLEEGHRLSLPQAMPKTLQGITLDCWHANPDSRPGFGSLLETLDSYRRGQFRGARSRTPARPSEGAGSVDRYGYVPMAPSTVLTYGGRSAIPRCESRGAETVAYWNGYKILKGSNGAV